MKILNQIYDFALNLLFPPRCEFCSELMEWFPKPNAPLCEPCLQEALIIEDNSCVYCGKRMRDDSRTTCGQCAGMRYYARVYSACEYEGLIRDKLLEFKFKGRKQLARALTWLIIEKLKMTNNLNFDIIVSVPVHYAKMNERGYNQSELIARRLADYYSKPLSTHSLVKSKPTESQSKLDKRDRNVNVRGAFELIDADKITGKKVLLVDDIITTGATVNECSRVLIEAGAKEVYVVTAATGKNDYD